MTALPPPPPEVPVDNSLEGLAPIFHARVNELLARMKARGHDPIVSESFRTNERQTYLWGFGREYDDGRGIVTHSRDADETWHHFGLAVDIISQSHGWDAPPRFWHDLGALSVALGLSWGGNWKSIQDRPHVQFGSPMRQSPSPRAARLLAQGGLEAVWKEVGAIL
jgi:peptidoglycan LD-endopeptidase CwlK